MRERERMESEREGDRVRNEKGQSMSEKGRE